MLYIQKTFREKQKCKRVFNIELEDKMGQYKLKSITFD
jgi:hypothetical protein